MRPTLHDYVIEQFEKWRSFPSEKSSYLVCYNFAKLTNRAPRLGDFVPCDEDGNVLEEPNLDDFIFEEHPELVGNPKEYNYDAFEKYLNEYQAAQDRVIFAGDWEVVQSFESHTVIQNENGVRIIFVGKEVSIGSKEINRIEELPREIDFKV